MLAALRRAPSEPARPRATDGRGGVGGLSRPSGAPAASGEPLGPAAARATQYWLGSVVRGDGAAVRTWRAQQHARALQDRVCAAGDDRRGMRAAGRFLRHVGSVTAREGLLRDCARRGELLSAWRSLGTLGGALGAAQRNAGGDGGGNGGKGPMWLAGGAAAAVCLGGGVAAASTQDGAFEEAEVTHANPMGLISDNSKRKFFFFYERRIREYSTPEKVFHYFASGKNDDGSAYMTPHDLLTALTNVFPPFDSSATLRSGALPGEANATAYDNQNFMKRIPPRLMSILDEDRDGRISFPEFLVFQALRSLPPADLRAIFLMVDDDGNGTIEAEEFRRVFDALLSARRSAGFRTGLRTGESGPGYSTLMRHLFGRDLRGRVGVDDFVAFIKEVDDIMVQLEFNHYDVDGSGTISGRDFAVAVVANAQVRTVERGLARADGLASPLASSRVSAEDFFAWGRVCFQHEQLVAGMRFFREIHGKIKRNDLARGIERICNVHLPDHVIDIVFHMMDMDGSGDLDFEEVEALLKSRLAQSYKKIAPRSRGLFRGLFD
ncbi:unnamed protein product [Pedinophyceae sp. YPF-701]|nr:unnamed protein product [Pedinophyceae sp. YPF-701]